MPDIRKKLSVKSVFRGRKGTGTGGRTEKKFQLAVVFVTPFA